MRYYVAIKSLLLPEDMKSDLRADLTDRLVDLYKLIIDFLVQTMLRFYRSRTKNFFRETINYDGCDKKLQDIKDGDKELVLKFETAMSATSLDVLKNLAEEAESDAKNRACLQDLQATDPREDMKRIEQDKGGLLRDSYYWILNHSTFDNGRTTDNISCSGSRAIPAKARRCFSVESLMS